jgi:hypothetical protein
VKKELRRDEKKHFDIPRTTPETLVYIEPHLPVGIRGKSKGVYSKKKF